MIELTTIKEIASGDLRTKVQDTEHTFGYKVYSAKNEEKNLSGWRVIVYSYEKKLSYHFFCANLVEFEDMIKLVYTDKNYEEYGKKSIPEYLLPVMYSIINKPIYSSTNNGNKSYEDEGRVPNATKYWKRAIALYGDRVQYLVNQDLYVYLEIELDHEK